MYVKAVITAKHQADGGGEGCDVVVDNLLVDAQHECLRSEAGGTWESMSVINIYIMQILETNWRMDPANIGSKQIKKWLDKVINVPNKKYYIKSNY